MLKTQPRLQPSATGTRAVAVLDSRCSGHEVAALTGPHRRAVETNYESPLHPGTANTALSDKYVVSSGCIYDRGVCLFVCSAYQCSIAYWNGTQRAHRGGLRCLACRWCVGRSASIFRVNSKCCYTAARIIKLDSKRLLPGFI
jgi:hypothetical protein